MIAGLATITPAAGFVGGLSPILFGVAGGVICYLAVQLKTKFGYDDSLDVVGVHMVAGLVGGLLLGLFADLDTFSADAGLSFHEGALLGGGWGGGALIWDQLVSMAAVLIFSGLGTYVIAKALDATMGLRIAEEIEPSGIDLHEHAEVAYSEVLSAGEATNHAAGSAAQARSTSLP